MEPERDLFGNKIDLFESALARYGVWPMTVWPVDFQDKMVQELKARIGDVGYATPTSAPRAGRAPYASERSSGNVPHWSKSTREGCFTDPANDDSVYRGKITASIFNPAVAAWVLNLFGPSSGTVFDPFAGGGTRAIMTRKAGLRYVGTELRADECAAVRARLTAVGITEGGEIIQADARKADMVRTASAAFVFTCPPYWTLEQYEGGAGDLSMLDDYSSFLSALGEVVEQTRRILMAGFKSVWVVGLHRHPDGALAPLHHDVARLHTQEGHFRLVEEVILWQKNNGSIQRVGNFEKGQGHLVRCHEYALVFEKIW